MKLQMMFAAAVSIAGLSWAPPATAKAYKNLKVLKDNGKTLKKGMKYMSKGLGVKCKACHIKGKWSKDSVANKDKSRAFFKAVVGTTDESKKDKALAELLEILKLDSPRDSVRLWKGISMLEKK